MPRTVRLLLFLLSMVGIAAALPFVVASMPPFGAHPLPYGDAINHLAPIQRHVTNMVTAVNFDYRGFDTLGEEIMLFAAVTGTAVLLRSGREDSPTDQPAQAPGRPIRGPSDGLVLAGRLFAPVTIVFGIYVVLHAQLTPGGGFQGGVIVASGLLLLYLCGGYMVWRRLMRTGLLDALEGGGAAMYAVAGLAPMAAGASYLENVLPPGQIRALLSGGMILILNWAVALAVAGGFGVLFVDFLKETRTEQEEEEKS
jgi:multicomponent Na+:H+ antiporter subunit B